MNATATETPWARIYSLRFGGREFDQTTAAEWEAEIRIDVANVQPGEIAAACRSIAHEDQEAQTPRKYPPNQTEIAKRIKKLRWQARVDREAREPGRPGCGVCRDGWIYYRETYEREPQLEAGGIGPGGIGIPCRCTLGTTILRKAYKETRWESLMETAKKVLKFQASIRAGELAAESRKAQTIQHATVPPLWEGESTAAPSPQNDTDRPPVATGVDKPPQASPSTSLGAAEGYEREDF